MASAFDDLVAGGPWSRLAAVHGETATRLPGGGGASSSVTVIFERMGPEVRYSPRTGGEVTVQTGMLQALPSTVTPLSDRDRFTDADGVTWAVERWEAAHPIAKARLVVEDEVTVGGPRRTGGGA